MSITGNFAQVNGLNMYYEIHGSGEPLLLLHGAYMTIGDWGELLPGFAKIRQVIAVELQGHGRTADIDRPFSYQSMADDCATLLGQLGFERVDVYGYSMGGGVAVQLAIRHPELVRRQVVVSAGMRYDDMYPEVIAMLEKITPEMLEQTPFADSYRAVAPRPEEFPRFVQKLTAFDQETFDWTDDVAKITAPTLLIVGDADIVSPESTIAMLRTLGGGILGPELTGSPKAQLAIIPNTSHLGMMYRTDLLLAIAPEFFNAPDPEAA